MDLFSGVVDYYRTGAAEEGGGREVIFGRNVWKGLEK